MLGWLVRALLVIAGSMASWVVARDDLHFEIVQMIIAVFLVTLAIAVAAFWPLLKAWFKRVIKKIRGF